MLLFAFGFNMLWLSLVSLRARPRTSPEGVPTELPRVTVQLPIYNELYVAKRVIEAAARLDYPRDRFEIQVLDDSTDETSTIVAGAIDAVRASGITIHHVRRTDRTGYKAGALAEGLKTATGELAAVFDADFEPPADFLMRTVGRFVDPQVGFVQARWDHLNRNHSWLTQLQALAIDGHFMVEQAARGERGYWFNFNGTAGVWRVSAIADAGGWTADTLTEDLDLSYRVHLAGWRGTYMSDLAVPGELPVHISGFRRQQHRWARGSLECAWKLLPAVWRSDAARTTKLQATAHLSAYGIHLVLFSLTLLYPLVVLTGNYYPGASTLFGVGYIFALTSVAPGVFFITGQQRLGRPWLRELPRTVLLTALGSGLMLNTVRAAFQIFTKPNPEFERTAKFGVEEAPSAWTRQRYQLQLDRIVYAEAALGLYSFFGASVAYRHDNWGVFVYAMLFGCGLLGVVGVTLRQAIVIHRDRTARAGRVVAEQSAVQANGSLPVAS